MEAGQAYRMRRLAPGPMPASLIQKRLTSELCSCLLLSFLRFTYSLLSPLPAPSSDCDLNDIMAALTPIAPKWYSLGLQFKLTASDLHEIDRDFGGQSKPVEQLGEVVKVFLEHREHKSLWKEVADGLRGIQEAELAKSVEEKYCEGEGQWEP